MKYSAYRQNSQTDRHRSAVPHTKSFPTLLLAAICSLGLVLASCGDNSTGVDGGNGNGNGGNGEPPAPTFSNVQEIFTANCGGCHIGQATSGVRLDGYDNVMGSVGNQYGEAVVQDSSAAGSPLVDKIESNPEFGARMPQGGPYLSTEQINLIKEWINEGAQNN